MQHLVIHYSEIGTKGKNRDFFEKKLMSNLQKVLAKESIRVYRRYGRILVELKSKFNKEKIIERLSILPGISSFSFASKTDLNFEKIKKLSLEVLKKETFDTFKVETNLSDKLFLPKIP